MALSHSLVAHVQSVLQLHVNAPILITGSLPVSGGYINKAYLLKTNEGNFFIKFNNVEKHPGMFAAEAEGLQMLAQTKTVMTPRVITAGRFRQLTYLLMEWIEPAQATPLSFRKLGRQLAAMHQNTSPEFGLNKDNFMSSLPQHNKYHPHWHQFFIQERLQPMVKLAIDKGALSLQDNSPFENLYRVLPDVVSAEPPALLHGDLWLGNCLFDTNEVPYLVDPGVYFGNREIDIAMTTLFGGFGSEFYDAYQEVYPLQKDWEKRAEIWNLYPLLILMLFGFDYQERVREVVRKYGSYG